jgi:hypothetical protein
MDSRVIAVICLAWAVSVTQPAQGDPIAQWITPWTVTLDTEFHNGNAATIRLFGASSTANGDVKDLGGAPERLPGTPAVAGSSASVTTSIFNDSQAITGVNFDRKFSLSGSPTGWNVQ